MLYMYSVHVFITTSARTDKPVKLTVQYDNLFIIYGSQLREAVLF